MAGVPLGIKDLILTKDIRTTFGSRLYADYVPKVDDVAVERLIAADAIILGKTNAAEFGYGGFGHNPLFPTTRNPWNTALTPGGSSAGSGAAVAAGICPLALGSDGGGSVRLPAAFCGLVGIKATMGRVPVWPGCRDADLPGVSGWESIEHYGPLARTVADAALMLSVMAGPDPRDRWSLPDEGVLLARCRRPQAASQTAAGLVPALGRPAGRAGGAGHRRGCCAGSRRSNPGDPRRDRLALRRSDRGRPRHRRTGDRPDRTSPHGSRARR